VGKTWRLGELRRSLASEGGPKGFAHPFLSLPRPQARGGTSVHIHLYVKDVDATVARATALGAKVVRPVQDQFYGDRSGSIEDPFGHLWHVATHKVDLSKGELKKRAEQAAKPAGG